MKCTQCGNDSVKTTLETDDSGDIKITACTEESCGYVLDVATITEDAQGNKRERKRPVRAEDQPEHLRMSGKGPVTIEEPILSAHEMMELAVRKREETIGKSSRDLLRTILEECAERVLEGNHDYLIREDDNIPGEVISLAYQELKDKGYKVRKKPEPGEGTWLQIKWPTKRPPRKKPTKAAAAAQPVEVNFPKQKKADLGTDKSQIKQQQAAARHRQQALKNRSSSPK